MFFGADDEVMLYGTVRYVLKADAEGKEVEVPWAGRVVFDLGDGSEVKMKFYQVYLVCIPHLLWGWGMFVVVVVVVVANECRILRRSRGRNKMYFVLRI